MGRGSHAAQVRRKLKKAHARKELHNASHPFLSLSEEMVVKIMYYLIGRDVKNVRLCCKRLTTVKLPKGIYFYFDGTYLDQWNRKYHYIFKTWESKGYFGFQAGSHSIPPPRTKNDVLVKQQHEIKKTAPRPQKYKPRKGH